MQNYRYGVIGVLLVLVLGGGAYYWNSVKEQGATSDSNVVATTPEASSAAKPAEAPAAVQEQQNPAEVKSEQTTELAAPETPQEAPKEANVPAFDILRVEPDGSVVIAGRATANVAVEVISGSKVLGTTKAGENGDFAIVLDEPLEPGDHQLVLRAGGAGGNVATSAQTAIVSVPDSSTGQVLALVEEPGQASRLITKPEAPAQQTTSSPEAGTTTTEQVPQVKADPDAPIAIEAVEIEGDKVFVAGNAKGSKEGATVVVNANDIMLGSSAISPEGRFLVQSQKPLAVGDYIIRADLVDSGGRVIATARVPFRREAGENVSAIASETSGQNGGTEDPATSAPLQKVEGSVIIRKGDNLWTISKRTYGKGTRYTTIYLANRDQIRNPDLILPGQVFVMPQQPLGDDEVQRRLQDSSN
ncbi:Ig-like domain-containing protein [Ochrobactrum quorumnocens]|jgi:nucleoid-associated protein YgaU|uniref:LysM peptidoglycan-binding domain-containing protein n=1 Tax=Ochrobactrum quorumnocens TaxID=271865 RepID=A0A5N1K8D5_9HYPH|nr:Ig-like domain-containing protein [[Ochrobactrum] quorumnocens]KAA9370494.1 LysM peptidoglycan-binding domain-containing protein [[Ochrobactrum] quorumnocens]MBD7990449.1 LysM peptidoglycan-binding domain-containing protein [Ochrobactrum gallinarum]